MADKYLRSDVGIGSDYITNLENRIVKILDKHNSIELHIQKFLELCLTDVQKWKLALSKEALLFLNEIYKGKY